MTVKSRAYMHSWCGTAVVTRHLPSIGGSPEIEAGKLKSRADLCPNPACTKPDFPWWKSSFDTSEQYEQLLFEFGDEVMEIRKRRTIENVDTRLV